MTINKNCIASIFLSAVFFVILFCISSDTSAHEIKSYEARVKDPSIAQELAKPIQPLSSQITGIVLNKDLKTSKSLQSIAKESAIDRKEAMLEIAKISPETFLNNTIPKEISAKLPADIKAQVEQETTITGKVNILHVDDFENPDNSYFTYKLKSGNTEYDLYPAYGDLHLLSNTNIKVKGYKLDSTIVTNISNENNVQVVGTLPVPDSVGEQKMLVFLVEFANTRNTGRMGQQEAYERIFNGQFQKFYKEQSYGKVWWTGIVTPVIKLDRDFVYKCDNNVGVQDSKIKQYILDNNINLADYDRVLYLMSDLGGCSSVGKSDNYFEGKTYSFSESWVNSGRGTQHDGWSLDWTSFELILSHELGHALGVTHANGWDCGDQSIYGDCKHLEAGNYFDLMGGSRALHFNAFYKDLLKWLPVRAIQNIKESGIYSLTALESPLSLDSSKKKMAKIIVPSISKTKVPYVLEFRKSLGFDQELGSEWKDGILVNKTKELFDSYNFSFPQLIDTTPSAKDWYEDTKDASLKGENILFDEGRGLKVGPVLSETEDNVTFKVEYVKPVCNRFNPNTKLFQSIPNNLVEGSYYFLSYIVTNQDGIGCRDSSLFEVSVEAPPEFKIDYIKSFTLKPEEEHHFYVTVSPGIPGSFPVKITVRNTKTNLSTSLEYVFSVSPKPVITSVSPTLGKIGDVFDIFGDNFRPMALFTNVLVQNNFGYSYIKPIELSNEKISFRFPSSLTCFSDGKECDVKFAEYNVYVLLGDSNFGDSNSNKFTIKVVPPLSDLSASPITPLTATVGQPQTFSTTISNNGSTRAGSSNEIIHIMQFDEDIDHTAVNDTHIVASGEIDPNSSKNIISRYTYTAKGIKYVRACADLDDSFVGRVTESNEDNNCSPWTEVTVGDTAQTSLKDPILNTYISTPSKTLTVGPKGLINGSKVSYDFISTKDKLTIREIKYFTSGTHDTVSSVKVGKVTAPVVGNVAHIKGLNMGVPAGEKGLNLTAYLSYAPQIPGTTSQSQVSIAEITYTYGGTSTTKATTAILYPTTSLPSPMMILVAPANTKQINDKTTEDVSLDYTEQNNFRANAIEIFGKIFYPMFSF